jgi:Ca-activated chloride channel family protein
MSGNKIMQANDALAHFLQTCHEKDEFYLIGFSSSPQLLLDGVRDDRAVLVSHGIYPKRAIILISDGEDNHSRRSLDQVRRRLQESDVAIYSIGIPGNSPSPKARLLANGKEVMDKLAAISGGKSFWPGNAHKMDEAFERIALELRRQYSIGYLPSNFIADGKLRRIKITVTAPRELSKLVVRSREGYYAVKKTDDRRARRE